MKARESTTRIRQYIVDYVGAHPADIPKVTANHFGISQQAALRHIRLLIRDGAISAQGNNRSRRYQLSVTNTFSFTLSVAGLAEDTPWRERILPQLNDVPKNVVGILQYGFTEMLNNVIDHSQSENAVVIFVQTPASIKIQIHDYGVGIFKKIMKEFNLPDEVTAIAELVKGKLTTDPDRHSGEGVFFTSRSCDYFCLLSGSLFFSHTQPDNDWLLENKASNTTGTHVTMSISLRSNRNLADVFHEFDNPEKFDYAFSKTHFPVSLFQYGHENLISRSQAKRVLQRLDTFKEVVLDFDKVEFIGQAFADEIFRVYQNSHTDTHLIPVNACDNVRKMINHVISPPTHLRANTATFQVGNKPD